MVPALCVANCGIDGVGHVRAAPRAGQVGHIGVVLVREHRVVRQAQLLRALDLGVPVRALDQAAHQTHLVAPGQRSHVLDQFERAGLVGLQGQAKAAPLRALGRHLGHQRLEHVQRQLQAVHLFGVDGQVDVGRAPRARTGSRRAAPARPCTRALLRILIARVQRAELDGYAVILLDSPRGIYVSSYGFDSILYSSADSAARRHRCARPRPACRS